MKKTNIRYYETYQDDFIKQKETPLKPNYKWLHKNIFYIIISSFFYCIALLISLIYSKLIKHITIKNKKILKGHKNYFIYANHTQAFGDVVNPFLFTFPKRPYFIVDKNNLNIPIIGKLLPLFGALPIPEDIHNMPKLIDAITYHINHNKALIIYPEAHVWPYNTFIREFPKTSFTFPTLNNSPVFIAVTTYQKRKHFKKPKITIYLDGPYTPDSNLTRKEKIKYLHETAYNNMVKLSKNSNIDYIKYKKK